MFENEEAYAYWLAIYGWPSYHSPQQSRKLQCVGGPLEGKRFDSDLGVVQAYLPVKVSYVPYCAAEMPEAESMPPITTYHRKIISPGWFATPVAFYIWETMLGPDNEPTDFALNYIMVNVFGAAAPLPKELA